MKLAIVNNQVTLIAENNQEAIVLLTTVQTKQAAPVATVPVRKHRKHRKHQFMKTCDQCGNQFRGGTGLATHKRKKHPTVSYHL